MLAAMTPTSAQLLDDIATLKAMVAARDQMIEALKLTISKLQHASHGASSERGRKLLDQLELQLAELQESVAQDGMASALTAPAATENAEAAKPARRPPPDHLPRERIVHPASPQCPCCGGKLRKLGEDITETLEYVPARWKVIQHVREKFACRKCEAITQPPAPFHPIARGRAGPQLLAQILFGKYRAHLPLNRQSEIYASEGVNLSVSTLADWVGAAAATLAPLVDAIRDHVFAAERIHADDTPVPVLAKTKTRLGRLWTYVRDDRPFGGQAPPAALFFYSPDRGGEHPRQHLAGWSGLMQADAYAGYAELYDAARTPAPIIELPCWSHARRKFYELATLKKAPIAIEAVRRIDELFAIEREINGADVAVRLAVRQDRSRPLVAAFEIWLRTERAKLSSKNPIAKAIQYSLKRWTAMIRFLDDGRICLSNNAAERALRGIAVGRHNWTFAGSDRGGERAAAVYTLIESCKLNDVDPRAWLADVLSRLPDHPASRIAELLPWNWTQCPIAKAA